MEHIQTPYFLTVDGDTQLKSTAVAALMDKMVSGKAACVAGNLLVAQINTWVPTMQSVSYTHLGAMLVRLEELPTD